MKTTAGQITDVCSFLKRHGVTSLNDAARILTAGGSIDIKHDQIIYRGHEISDRHTYRGMWCGTHENYSGPPDPCYMSHLLSEVLDEIDEWHLGREAESNVR